MVDVRSVIRHFSGEGRRALLLPIHLAVRVLHEKNSPVLLVCNQWLPDPPPGIKRTLLFTSRPGMVADEIYSVYRLQAE